ncbi:MAG: hypothetical protein WEC73_01075 [Chthoniobacterales bacterium]
MKKLILPITLIAASALLGACTRNTYVLVAPKPTTASKPASVRKAPASVATNMGDGFEAVSKPTSYSNP